MQMQITITRVFILMLLNCTAKPLRLNHETSRSIFVLPVTPKLCVLQTVATPLYLMCNLEMPYKLKTPISFPLMKFFNAKKVDV